MANKRLILMVDLEFDEDANFDDAAIKEITEKVAGSIRKTDDEIGITPDGYETSIAHIRVTEHFSNICSIESL